jgi:hypothetical protein
VEGGVRRSRLEDVGRSALAARYADAVKWCRGRRSHTIDVRTSLQGSHSFANEAAAAPYREGYHPGKVDKTGFGTFIKIAVSIPGVQMRFFQGGRAGGTRCARWQK